MKLSGAVGRRSRNWKINDTAPGVPGIGKRRSRSYMYPGRNQAPIKALSHSPGVNSDHLYILTETDVEYIIEAIRSEKPDLVIIDSIQTMSLGDLSSPLLAALPRCENVRMPLCAPQNPWIFQSWWSATSIRMGQSQVQGFWNIWWIPFFILKGTGRCLRILRAVKTAMDPPTKLVYLKWRRTALREVENPSMMLLSGRPKNVSGTCVAWA